MPSIQQTLRNFRLGQFSLPSRRTYHHSERVELARGRFGVAQWVLSRALCRFNRFDLNRLPAGKRKAALALQLPQWSPFKDSNYAIIWQQGFASVWCWDNSRVEAEIQKHGRNPKAEQKIPETLLRPAMQDGLRLLKCLDGAEGQYWQDGQLVSSRWWPQQPDAHAWLSFQRDCGIPSEQQKSGHPVQELPLQAQPWEKVSSLAGASDDTLFAETVIYAVLVLALGLPSIYMGVQQFRVRNAIAERSAELAALKKQAAPLFDAREAALGTLSRLKAIYALDRFPQPLVLMAAVSRTLPRDGAFVRDWEMTDDQIKITVSSPNGNITGTTYVEALEKIGPFAEVKIITNADPKLMTFAMTVLPLEPIDNKTNVTDKRPAL